MYDKTLREAELKRLKSKNKIKEEKKKEKPESMFKRKESKSHKNINKAYDKLVQTKATLLKKAHERNAPKEQIEDLRKDYERVLKRQKLK